MKILSLALILLIAGRSNSSEKFEPSQIEAELAMKMLFVMLNIVSAEMSTMTGSPKQHFEIKKMTLKQCEEDKFEGERAAYCDIDAVIVEDGKEEKQELKEIPFLKKYGVWITPPPII
ncbi:hypothetical protein [Cardiobacterium hominis]|nr:hypothetical protein [Cardiobacterium hominis]